MVPFYPAPSGTPNPDLRPSSMPPPQPRKLLRDEIYAYIKERLLSCEIAPGTEIVGQHLADRFGVSLSPVRDALHRLQMEGLIDVIPRQGYYASSISLEDALELYEMRIVLESACADRIVRATSDADLAALDRYRHGPAAGSRHDWIVHNKEFHLLLAALCGNSRLRSTTQEILQAFDRLTMASISQPVGVGSRGTAGLAILDHEHSELIDALKARDAALAVSLIRRHIESSRTRFLESYNSSQAA